MVELGGVRGRRWRRLFHAGVWGCALVLIGLGGLPAADAQPIGAAVSLPDRISAAVESYRGAAADAALGHPVTYGDGQCYGLIQNYNDGLGYGWRLSDPSGNAFDLYKHFDTNGLGEYYQRIPFDAGTNAPHVGDIVVYDSGGYISQYGHAGVVTAVRDSGDGFGYQVAEQNSGGRLFVTENWRDFDPAFNTLGYLRPKA